MITKRSRWTRVVSYVRYDWHILLFGAAVGLFIGVALAALQGWLR